MTYAGASLGEIGLVVVLVVLVVIGPKVSKIGEAVGGLFERRSGKKRENGR